MITGEFILRVKGDVVATAPNVITSGGLHLIAMALASGNNIQVMQMSIGDDSTAPAATDTELGNERIRVAVRGRSIVGNSRIQASAQFLGSVSNFHIREVGVWVGTTLFAHSDLTYNNAAGGVDLELQHVTNVS